MMATAKEAFMVLMLTPAAVIAIGLVSWMMFNDGAVR